MLLLQTTRAHNEELSRTTRRTEFKLQRTCWESRNKVPLLDMAQFDRYPEGDVVALCKPVKPMYIVAEIEGVECKIMMDSCTSRIG